eukprot:75732-Pelagomonas_calceolata.AAC.1
MQVPYSGDPHAPPRIHLRVLDSLAGIGPIRDLLHIDTSAAAAAAAQNPEGTAITASVAYGQETFSWPEMVWIQARLDVLVVYAIFCVCVWVWVWVRARACVCESVTGKPTCPFNGDGIKWAQARDLSPSLKEHAHTHLWPSGGPTLLAAIGNDKTGGIAVLRPGLITDLMVEQQLPAVHGMWAIRHRSGLSLDSFRSPCPCLKNKEKWTGCKGFAYPRTLDQGLLPPMWHPCPSWKYSYGIDVHGLLPLMWHPCPSWIGSRAWIYVELMLDSCP